MTDQAEISRLLQDAPEPSQSVSGSNSGLSGSTVERVQRPARGDLSDKESAFAEPMGASKYPSCVNSPHSLRISLLTGGGDKPYALGLATALTSAGISVDFVGSDELNVPELVNNPRLNFLNLRGDQSPGANIVAKILRVGKYYLRLIRYAATAEPKIFHILWNNKFELIDRTVLMLYYKLLGKKLVFTAHNVNGRKRDAIDSLINRLSLRVQYRLNDHTFVHTDGMKKELVTDFGVYVKKASVVPFGINNTVPSTALSVAEAKRKLGIEKRDKTLLLFGNIAPYKGLEYLISAFSEVASKDKSYRLIVAGRHKASKDYREGIQRQMRDSIGGDRIIEKMEYIPDEEIELYFKAADVLILPYTHVFQSGVLLLGYSFGLPAIASDVGCLKEDIIEGKTGFVCRPRDSTDLARSIGKYFESDLYRNLEGQRLEIKRYANERYSWDKLVATTIAVYSSLLCRSEGGIEGRTPAG